MKLPKTFMGAEVKGAYQNYLDRQKNKTEQETPVKQPLSVQANIDRADYVNIPNTNIIIAKFEPDKYKEIDWEGTHFKLAENGLYMPPPALFMFYFVSVIGAYNGKIQLYDGEGNIILKEEIEGIYKHLTTDHINGGAWSHLDAKFSKDGVETDHRVINGELKGKKQSLDKCLMENCYTSLNFNKQGLAIKKSEEQEYKQGENIYYWCPRNGRVAGFGAYSDGAYLDCCRDPQDSLAELGVFSCAEGTSKN